MSFSVRYSSNRFAALAVSPFSIKIICPKPVSMISFLERDDKEEIELVKSLVFVALVMAVFKWSSKRFPCFMRSRDCLQFQGDSIFIVPECKL